MMIPVGTAGGTAGSIPLSLNAYTPVTAIMGSKCNIRTHCVHILTSWSVGHLTEAGEWKIIFCRIL